MFDILAITPQMLWAIVSLWMLARLQSPHSYQSILNYDKISLVMLLLGIAIFVAILFLKIPIGYNRYIDISPMTQIANITLSTLIVGGVLLGRTLHKHRSEHDPELYPTLLLHTAFLTLMIATSSLLGLMVLIALSLPTTKIIFRSMAYAPIDSVIDNHRLTGVSSILFLLIAVALLNGNNIPLFFSDIMTYQTVTDSSLSIKIGIGALLTAIILLLGVVPMHSWIGESLNKINEECSVYTVIAERFVATVILVKIFSFAWVDMAQNWQGYLLFFAVPSMIWGAYMTLTAGGLRSILTGGFITQNGFILIMLSTRDGGAFYIILPYLMVTTVAFWCCVVFCSLAYRRGRMVDSLTDISGVLDNYGWRSLVLLIGLFTLAGIPPTSGFWLKMGVYYSALNNVSYVVMYSVIACLILTAIGYLRVVAAVYFGSTRRILDSSQNAPLMIVTSCMCVLLMAAFFVPFVIQDYLAYAHRILVGN